MFGHTRALGRVWQSKEGAVGFQCWGGHIASRVPTPMLLYSLKEINLSKAGCKANQLKSSGR